MSQFVSNPTAIPANINRQFHQFCTQSIDQLTSQVDYQTKAQLMHSLNNNANVIGHLHQFILNEGMRRNVDLRVPGASLRPEDLGQILHNWAVGTIESIRQMMMQQQHQQYQQQPPMFGGGFGGQPASPASMYATGPSAPVQQPPPFQPHAQPTPQQAYPGAPAAQAQPAPTPPSQPKESPKMTIEALSFVRDPSEELSRIDANRGLEILDTPRSAVWNDARVSLITLKSQRVASSVFEAYRDLDRLLPDAMKRSYWTHRLFYSEIGHIPMSTHEFLTVRDQVRARYEAERWRGVIAVLQDTKQGTWDRIDAYLTARLNDALWMKLRTEQRLDVIISISTIRDLPDLCDPHFQSPVAEHPAFPETLDSLINRVMMETFINDTLVGPTGDDSVTALMKCPAVDYYKGHITKYDYGVLPEEQKYELLRELFATNTVFELPRCLVATNSIDPGETLRLADHNYVVSPERQGVFEQVFTQLADDTRGLPTAIVLNRYRTPPAEFLNILRPVYPMGGKRTIWLVGSNNRTMGW